MKVSWYLEVFLYISSENTLVPKDLSVKRGCVVVYNFLNLNNVYYYYSMLAN